VATGETETKRVLIADDEINIRRVLEAILRRDGYDVVTAANGDEALAGMSRGVSTVITDLKMPGLDGMGLLRRLSVEYPDVPVIMITAVTTATGFRIDEEGEVPDWLKGLGQKQEPAAPQEPVINKPGELLPDWLKTSGPSNQESFASSTPEEATAVPSQPVPEKQPDLTELPDWISSLKPAEPQGSKPSEPVTMSLSAWCRGGKDGVHSAILREKSQSRGPKWDVQIQRAGNFTLYGEAIDSP